MADEDIQIPTYIDLMRPTLEALAQLGGEGTNESVDEKLIEVAGLTAEQMAVEFEPEQSQTGSKVLHRAAWARTYLRKAELIENPERGRWILLDAGRGILDVEPHEADQLLADMDRQIRKDARDLGTTAVRRAGDPTFEPTYDAAREWRDTSLRTGVSLFDPDRMVWTSDIVADLRYRVIEHFDESARSFSEKLADQLAGASQEVHLLAAEMLYVHLLALSNVTARSDAEALLPDWQRRSPLIPTHVRRQVVPQPARSTNEQSAEINAISSTSRAPDQSPTPPRPPDEPSTSITNRPAR